MRRWQPLSPLAGIGAVALWVVGTYLLEKTDRPEGKDSAAFAAWVADNDTSLIAGTVVFGFGVLLFVWFIAALRERLLLAEGVVVVQHFSKRAPAAAIGALAAFRARRFGETTLTFYRAATRG